MYPKVAYHISIANRSLVVSHEAGIQANGGSRANSDGIIRESRYVASRIMKRATRREKATDGVKASEGKCIALSFDLDEVNINPPQVV